MLLAVCWLLQQEERFGDCKKGLMFLRISLFWAASRGNGMDVSSSGVSKFLED
jgi:hypothetical protein